MKDYTDHLVIGGGIYGSHVALALQEAFPQDRVVLVDAAEEGLMSGASAHNHGRLHYGYQYPLDLPTAKQAKDDVSRFTDEYGSTIQENGSAFYGIHSTSRVSPEMYEAFCTTVGLAYEPVARSDVYGKDIAASYQVFESSISLTGLSRLVHSRLEDSAIEMYPYTTAERIFSDSEGTGVTLGDTGSMYARNIFNCGYGRLNELHRNSNLPILPITNDKYALFGLNLPSEMKGLSATVLYGPYGSIVSNDKWGTHVLAHVEHSNIARTRDYVSETGVSMLELRRRAEAALSSTRDYLLPLSEASIADSMVWDRAVLGSSPEKGVRSAYMESGYGGLPGYNLILGGKLTGFYRAARFAVSAAIQDSGGLLSA